MEKSYDIVMYYAFCAIKLVMEVLTFCANSSNWELFGTIKAEQTLVGNTSDSSNFTSDRLSKDSRNCMERFQQVRLIFDTLTFTRMLLLVSEALHG